VLAAPPHEAPGRQAPRSQLSFAPQQSDLIVLVGLYLTHRPLPLLSRTTVAGSAHGDETAGRSTATKQRVAARFARQDWSQGGGAGREGEGGGGREGGRGGGGRFLFQPLHIL